MMISIIYKILNIILWVFIWNLVDLMIRYSLKFNFVRQNFSILLIIFIVLILVILNTTKLQEYTLFTSNNISNNESNKQ